MAEKKTAPAPDQDLKAWQRRRDAARSVRDQHKDLWQANLDAYKGTPLKVKPSEDWVNVTLDAALVDIKKAQLFFQSPDVRLKAMEPVMEGRQGAVALHEIVVNEMIGPDGIDARRLMDKVLVDVLITGLGPTKIGYRATTVPVTQTVQMPVPIGGAPAMDPLTGAPLTVPMEQTVDVPVHEDWFWARFSPLQVLIPHDFYDTEFDKAPWLGLDLTIPKQQAIRDYGLTEDDLRATVTKHEHVFDHGAIEVEGADDLVTLTEIWYHAAQFDADVVHPEMFRRKVLIDGVDRDVTPKDPMPYQTKDPMGRLTPDSMIGNPIHIFTTRDLPDSAYPPSDCSLTRSLVNELCKFRTQMVQQRDRSIPMRWVDITTGVFDTEALDNIRKGVWQSVIPVNGNGMNAMGEIARANYPRENYTAQDYILQDIEKVWSIGANQMGVTDEQTRTATEVQTVQQASTVKLDAERTRVLSQFVKGVAKLDALIQRFMSPERYAEILGEKGAQIHQQWDGKVINARFAYSARPDSSIRMDAAAQWRKQLDVWRFFAQDPNFARVELSKPILRDAGFDPEKLIVTKLPEKGPAPPSGSVAFKMEDFIGPQAPVAVQFANKMGMEITPEMLEMTQQLGAMYAAAKMRADQALARAKDPVPSQGTHGGMAPEATPMDKHQDQKTGGMQGLPGGGVQ